MEIRKYQAEDRADCQRICIRTAPPQKSEQSERALLLLYNDYYTEREPDNCFVLDDGNGNAVGYILTSSDFQSYKEVFCAYYLPEIKRISRLQYYMRKFAFHTEKRLAEKYPAHLHIDLLPGYTGKGEGGKLMEAALSNLRNKGVKGIFLGVGSRNTGAVRFYKRHGFDIILRLPGVYYMAREI